MKLLFLDTETTGVVPGKSAVIQIAGIVEIDGKVLEEFQFWARPHEGAEISPKALEVIGKTEDELRKLPNPVEAYFKMKNLLEKYVPKFTKDPEQRFKIAGQNIAFDYGMMEAFFQNFGDRYWYASVDRRGIDVMHATALFTFAGKIKCPNMKLGTVAAAMGIELQAHDAMNDIRATREVFQRYVEFIRRAEGDPCRQEAIA